jgi:hypothetical protein
MNLMEKYFYERLQKFTFKKFAKMSRMDPADSIRITRGFLTAKDTKSLESYPLQFLKRAMPK